MSSLSDADVDAIEADAKAAVNVGSRVVITLCAEVRRLRADWTALAERLEDRRVMAREVLEAEGLGHVAALVPIEEVQTWIRELM